MSFNTRIFNNIAVVELGEAFNIYNAPDLRIVIDELITMGKKSLILNLAGVRFIDSCGIGALISALISVKKSGGILKISNLNGYVQVIFERMNSIELFEIYESEAEAINSLCTDM